MTTRASSIATIVATDDAGGPGVLQDEHGWHWFPCGDDRQGRFMVERRNLDASGVQGEESCEAGYAVWRLDGSIDLYRCEEGDTFGINCQDEFIVENDEWEKNFND